MKNPKKKDNSHYEQLLEKAITQELDRIKYLTEEIERHNTMIDRSRSMIVELRRRIKEQ